MKKKGINKMKNYVFHLTNEKIRKETDLKKFTKVLSTTVHMYFGSDFASIEVHSDCFEFEIKRPLTEKDEKKLDRRFSLYINGAWRLVTIHGTSTQNYSIEDTIFVLKEE
jgi:hypothetical protein